MVAVLDFYQGSNLLIGTKKLDRGRDLAGYRHRLAARYGPEVSGPAVALLLAVTGRKARLDDLTGDGVPALRERLTIISLSGAAAAEGPARRAAPGDPRLAGGRNPSVMSAYLPAVWSAS